MARGATGYAGTLVVAEQQRDRESIVDFSAVPAKGGRVISTSVRHADRPSRRSRIEGWLGAAVVLLLARQAMGQTYVGTITRTDRAG